jgi:hypothetical protein
MDTTPRYVATIGAARMLDLGVDRVRQLARAGELPHIVVDGRRVYRVADVDALRARRAAKREERR